jgi:replication factor A1
MIQATMFNETAERWNSKLEENKVYIFANGKVNLANKRFTSIKNDYSLTFGNETEI